MSTVLETSEKMLNTTRFKLGIPEKEEKQKGSEKIFEDYTIENFPKM